MALTRYLWLAAVVFSSTTYQASALAQTKGEASEKSDCQPLPKEFRAFFQDRVEGEEFVDLKLPPENSALTELKAVPKDLKISFLNKSGGRDMGKYAVEIDAAGKAKVEKSGLDDVQRGSKKISKKKLLDFIHQLGEIGFMDITSESLRTTCKGSMTHAATITVTVSFGDQSNSVTHYSGCNPGKKSDTQLALQKVSEAIHLLTKDAKFGKAESLYKDVQRID